MGFFIDYSLLLIKTNIPEKMMPVVRIYRLELLQMQRGKVRLRIGPYPLLWGHARFLFEKGVEYGLGVKTAIIR